MKKILFFQLKGNSYAGVWQVNKIIGENLINKGYNVKVLALRNNKDNVVLTHDPRLTIDVINKKDRWEDNYTGQEIFNDLKKIKILNVIKMTYIKTKHNISKYLDSKKVKKYILNYNPDYIITSHYELIDMVPTNYLNITYHEQHSSFASAISNIGAMRILNKYKDKIKFIWLSKKTMEEATKFGFKENYYIYNPVRFKCNRKVNIINNKRLVTLGRISKEKRIPLMVDIVNKVFKDSKFKDWTFEIYGDGPELQVVKDKIKNNKQIKYMGVTDNPYEVFINSSINLNTSTTEGFSMTILEACECGIPTITFDFGESVQEEIINNKTGIIARDINEYTEKLKELMNDKEKLEKMSKNVKYYAKNFMIENIIKKWLELLK